MEKQLHEVGKRKNAIARVYLRPRAAEVGTIRVNGRSFEDYFPRPASRLIIMQVLELTSTVGRFDIHVNVRGGGLSGQAGAVRHGISKALTYFEPDLRPVLKKGGFLTRDSRVVERKKYGHRKARASFQFSKR